MAKPQLRALFEAVPFADRTVASGILQRLLSHDGTDFVALLPALLAALESSADPDRSLVYLERFSENYGPALFHEIQTNPRLVEHLVTLFSISPFLTEILLRTPDAFSLLSNRQSLVERKTIEQYQSEAVSAFRSAQTDPERLDALRRYQRRQLLRIGTSDFLDLYDLRAVFSQLTRMAIGLLRACLLLARQQTGIKADEISILAMGKLGGWELNYSSDIDLLFVVRKDAEEYSNLIERFVEIVSKPTGEGFLYRVDLRLRPWGKDGPLIATLDGYLQYVQKDARLWEKQAFLKARPVAGNLSLGEELRRRIEPLLFRAQPEEVRTSIFAMKQRTEQYLKQKGRHWGEVKLGEGSIRDIEFVVQSLQLVHPNIRTRATLKAISHLRESGLLPVTEAHVLAEGYIFLRTVEHYLQIIDYRQTYTLPSDPVAIALLARRLGFEGPTAGQSFVERYEQHCHAIRSLFLKYVGNEPIKEAALSITRSPEVDRHIERMDPSYTAAFSQAEIREHALLAAKIDNDTLAIVDARPLKEGNWRVTVVGYDYLGELSLICGLLFVYGFDILESNAFTYEPLDREKPAGDSQAKVNHAQEQGVRRKIVDVFNVQPVGDQAPTPETWAKYADDLRSLLRMMHEGRRREARGALAKRIGAAFHDIAAGASPLYPIDIEIDNETSPRYTVLNISAPDTLGFLYEFSNALAYYQINIARMFVQSIGKRANDTFFVTDIDGQKITSPQRQRELRAAIVLIKHFTHLLPRSPNPETALLHFREFIFQLFERPNWPDELARLERSEVLESLARLLGVSDFLWDDFLRMQYSNLFPVVSDTGAIKSVKPRPQLEEELAAALAGPGDWRASLNAFKDREMFRIDMRHILGQTAEFWDFAAELTDLAEVILETAFRSCLAETQAQYGVPLGASGQPGRAALFALGKCGGRELGFASDIELMLIYDVSGKVGENRPVASGEFYEELMRSLVEAIYARREGIFQIDLRLRPYGKAGSLAVSLEAFQQYFEPRGPAWAYERQALVKLRPIAGDRQLGVQVCQLRDQYVYGGEPFDVTAMRAMRERQVRHLVTAGTFNAKYSPGGLVDVEYLVQGLQIMHGAQDASLRLTNIRVAMSALAKAGILSEEDYACLRKAHTFLRWLIDSLRVVRGNSKDIDIPPFASEEFGFLARRLRYGTNLQQLREDLERYPREVQKINARLLPV